MVPIVAHLLRVALASRADTGAIQRQPWPPRRQVQAGRQGIGVDFAC